MESRTQGSRPKPKPRPRTQKIRGQGQGPRTQAQVFSKKNKNGLQNFFSGDLKKRNKKGLQNFFQVISSKKTSSKIFFQAIYKISTSQKKCCPRAEDRAIFEDLRPRGQGQRLDLRGQGQGLQNVSSRPRTSSRTPPMTNTKDPPLFLSL